MYEEITKLDDATNGFCGLNLIVYFTSTFCIKKNYESLHGIGKSLPPSFFFSLFFLILPIIELWWCPLYLHFFFMSYCYVKEKLPNVIPCSFLTAAVFSGSEWYFKKWWGHPSAIYFCTISQRSCLLSFSDNFIIHTLFLWLFW